MNDINNIDRKNIWHPFTPLQGAPDPILITKGDGVYLHTSDGRKIIDAVSSWWVNLHGHGNSHIAKAIADQAMALEHVIFAGFTHEPAVRLSQNLLSLLPADHQKIFFSDNGSTAVEVALKMAIQYWHNRGVEKTKIIAIDGAYHGDTFGSMSVAERGLFTRPFFPFLFDTAFIDFPNGKNDDQVIKQFEALVSKQDAAAFIFEPLVQAAAGMRIYSPKVLDALIAIAKKNDVLCIADEVFTGFGRTGKHFAVDHLQYKPDIIALSKGITGGFLPLGVTTCTRKITDAFESPAFDKTFFHGHSYTANPLACAAANASFTLLTKASCQQKIRMIEVMHRAFADSMTNHRAVGDVRTLGTIVAIELKTSEETAYENSIRKKIYPFFLERNILLRPLGHVIYVLPPYVIEATELEAVYQAIREFLSDL
ncbi:MAG TPA: adenosylmethionine--8-amino-7-oxononanoate transaminase [Chryseosolibacter sp.]|nr:adenosylmethionine--8-amino-7-oxononanoate transaminase [Chryseosolibacter sp.]